MVSRIPQPSTIDADRPRSFAWICRRSSCYGRPADNPSADLVARNNVRRSAARHLLDRNIGAAAAIWPVGKLREIGVVKSPLHLLTLDGGFECNRLFTTVSKGPSE